MEAWHRDGPPAAVADSDFPVVVAHGDLDEKVIPPANAESLVAHWPGAQIEFFPGCGHALMAQEPQRLAQLIGRHVSSPAR